MSSTLTWYNSGLQAKTGTTAAACFADMISMFTSRAADPDFSWIIASSNTVSNPLYIVLKLKAGGVGRALIVHWTSPPAANNPTLLTASPGLNIYISYFPNGNTDVPSNLNAASGTIMGDDTGALRVNAPSNPSTMYGNSIQPFYFDSQEAFFVGFQNPSSPTAIYGFGAGKLIVDAADNAYDCTVSAGNASLDQITNSVGSPTFAWNNAAANYTPGTGSPRIATNYGGSNSFYFQAWSGGAWAGQAAGTANDVMIDTATSKVFFVPIVLLGHTKGQGFALKLRQIAIGPPSLSAFAAYSSTGPIIQARQFCGSPSGNKAPWFTNFKL
ncbi:MAG TPA: hypothetical protein VHK27_07125 [Gammaproteobacteria bacterium]|nr:hypothetical protein [Gammaproteobacteria bacterium]